MLRLDVDTRRVAGHTLVEGRLHNDAPSAVRVTLATPLSPVYPPRSHGRPVEGWRPDEGRTTVCLAAGQHAGVGFATPATPASPDEQALVVVETEPDPTPDGGLTATPAGVLGALGDPLPPPAVTTDREPSVASCRASTRATDTPAAVANAAEASARETDAADSSDERTNEHGETARSGDGDPDLRRLRRAATDLARAAAAAEGRLGGERR